MKIRPIDLDIEYDTLKTWWERRGLVAPSKVILQGATGFCVHAGADIVAGWIYVSNKGVVGFVEWVTSNPAMAASITVRQALVTLYDVLSVFAKDAGCCVLFTTTPNGGPICRFLGQQGWQHCPGDPHIHMVKVLP